MLRVVNMFVLVLFSLAVSAKESNRLVFNHMSIAQGLSQQSVLSIYQDELDRIWVGTFCGVDVFDGRSIINISAQSDKHYQIHGNEVVTICGDKKGRVYLHHENGLSIISLADSATINLWNPLITTIGMGKNSLLVAIDSIIYYLEGDKLIRHPLQPPKGVSITVIHEHSNGTLWIGTYKGCFVLDQSNVRQINNYNVCSLFETAQGEMWLGTTNNGGILYNKYYDVVTHLSVLNGLSNNYVRDFVEDQNRNIWVATFWGLNKYDPQRGSNVSFVSSADDPFSLSHNSIYSLLIDREQTLWIGTYYGGVNYVNTNGALFEYYNLLNSSIARDNKVIAGSIVEDSQGNVWVGTDGSGLKKIAKNTGIVTHFSEKFGKNNFFNNIKTMLLDKQDHLWIGVHLEGLYYYDNNRFKHVPIKINGVKDTYNYSIITQMCYYGDKILLGTYGGILMFDPITLIFEKLDIKGELSHIKKISTIFLDSRDNLWVGTKGNGLYKCNLKSNSCERYLKTIDNSTGQIANNHITQISEDKFGVIWIATYGGGVNVLENGASSFSIIDSSNSNISNNYIQSIYVHNDSLLLLGTKSSFAIIDFKKRRIVSEINYQSGLPLDEILERTLCVTKDNKLYLGGKNGIVKFDSQQFSYPSSKPIFFSKLFVNNIEVNPHGVDGILETSLRESSHIRLAYSQNTFELSFSSPSFIRQIKRSYEYTLEGFDKYWIRVADKDNISYANVPVGTYKLRLRDVMDADNEVSLQISVLPPWYLSISALACYFAFLSYLVYLYVQSRRRKMKLHLVQIENSHMEQMNKKMGVFFTNISHEFKTPLTLITGLTTSLLQSNDLLSSQSKKIIKIKSNATRLQRLIGELLEFHKQEQGHAKLVVYKIPIIGFIKDTFNSFKEYAYYKKINYRFETCSFDDDEVDVWIDPIQMERVFYNLLMNAFKFTPQGGTIVVEVQTCAEWISISIDDSGLGIKASELDKIFNRFYQSKELYESSVDGVSGSGIGLSLAKEIVIDHCGELCVESVYGKGSIFTVKLRRGSSHFPEECISAIDWISHSDFGHNQGVIDYDSTEEDSQIAVSEIQSVDQTNRNTILIVEDSIELRNFIVSLFTDVMNTIVAGDGAEGLAMACKHLPDLILSDVMMPNMSGIEMSIKLKSYVQTSHIPIILLTANNEQSSLIRGLKSGADDYITKPFENEILVLKCLNLINSRRLLHEKFSNSGHLNKPIHLASKESDRIFYEKIERIIYENIENQNLDVLFLARAMCMSRSKFYHKVEALSGASPLEMINNFRLQRATELMSITPQTSIADISLRVGFNSSKYFTRCFKLRYGCTPSEYIKKEIL